MKKQLKFSRAADQLNRSCFRLQPLILIGMTFLLFVFPACSTIRLQINQFTQKPSLLPRDLKSPEQDSDILNESACIVTVNDDSGVFFMGKEQVAGDQITGKIAEKLKDHTPDKRIVYLESAASVQYKTVVSLLNSIRKAEIDKVGLVVIKTNNERLGAQPTMFEVKIFSEPDESEILSTKPNPLTLVVEISKSGALSLNKEPMGQIGESSAFSESLSKIFNEREEIGVFREGTNEIEKTILIKAPRSIKYGDVVKVVDAAKIAGAQPIGLQVDDLID